MRRSCAITAPTAKIHHHGADSRILMRVGPGYEPHQMAGQKSQPPEAPVPL